MAESLQIYYSYSQGVKPASPKTAVLKAVATGAECPPTHKVALLRKPGVLDRQFWLRGPETATYVCICSQHCVCVCFGRMMLLMYVNSCVLIKIEIFLTVWNTEFFGAAQCDNGLLSVALEHRR